MQQWSHSLFTLFITSPFFCIDELLMQQQAPKHCETPLSWFQHTLLSKTITVSRELCDCAMFGFWHDLFYCSLMFRDLGFYLMVSVLEAWCHLLEYLTSVVSQSTVHMSRFPWANVLQIWHNCSLNPLILANTSGSTSFAPCADSCCGCKTSECCFPGIIIAMNAPLLQVCISQHFA